MANIYESELLYKLMERDGFNIPSSIPKYEAEIKDYLIEQVKLGYPKLNDYEAEWLFYNYTNHIPAEFPIETITNVTNATVNNVVPYGYKSAILKGNTMVNYFKPLDDVNASGSICGFQDGKIAFQFGDESSIWGISYTSGNGSLTNSIKVSPNTKYFVKLILSKPIDGAVKFGNFKESEYSTSDIITLANNNTIIYQATMTTGTDTDYIGVILNHSVAEIVYGELLVVPYQEGMENWDIPYFEGMQSVKMPVLTTTGKNLFHSDIQVFNHDNYIRTGNDINTVCDTELKPSTTYTLSWNGNNRDGKIRLYSNGVETNSINIGWHKSGITFTTSEVEDGFSFYTQLSDDSSLTSDMSFNVQLEEGTTATPFEPYKSNILTVNENVTLRSNGSVYDELDLLTGKLTQRIDEDGSVLTQEVVKTVDLNVVDENGNEIKRIIPIEGTMQIQTDGEPIKPTVSMEIPVEAITQNLASFIEMEV